jgi:cytochrome c oxidase subunit 1
MNIEKTNDNTTLEPGLSVVKLYLGIGLLVFALMMLAGVIMRASQGTIINFIGPDIFYKLMTLHGAGMVGTAGLAGLAVNWYFLSKYVSLKPKVFLSTLLLSLVAVILIIGSILIGNFSAGWTFLYPLPESSGGFWSNNAAMVFIIGLLLLGVAFLVTYLDIALALIKRYGNLSHALGLPMLFGFKPIDTAHPTTVVASTMVLIVNTIGIAVGAVVLVLTLASMISPDLKPDPLLMKNLIYFFGHVFINATIYAAVTAVYEILPIYTNRPWKVSKPFLAAWFAATFMVMAVYPHHLLMDFVMPHWMLAMGQIISYTSGIPVLVVTSYGGLMLIYRSNIKWDATSSLLVMSLFGWSAGVVPAIVDGMIHVNKIMHNTLWVPGHFHFYLLLGLLPMVLGFCFYLVSNGRQGVRSFILPLIYCSGSLALCLSFLFSGWESVPRRFAVYIESWQWLSNVGAIAGSVILVSVLLMALPILWKLPKATLSNAPEHG